MGTALGSDPTDPGAGPMPFETFRPAVLGAGLGVIWSQLHDGWAQVNFQEAISAKEIQISRATETP
eukprot:scaffold228901_cov18-Prasinocladus_malaysianus.AAC.1